MIILFTANTAGSVDLNLLITLVVSGALLLANSNGVYKKWPYNCLESFFYLVFSAGVAYAKLTHGNVAAVVDTCFALTMVAFIAVLAYHVLHRVGSFRKYYYHQGMMMRMKMTYRLIDRHNRLQQVY